MSIFIGVHKLPPGMSEAEVKESWDKYKISAQAKGLKTTHVNYSLEKGIAHCETEAENAEEVQAAHDEANIPVEEIMKVTPLN